MKIKELLYDDIQDALSIYEQGIAAGNATFQTEAPSVEEWDREHLPFGRLKAVNEEGKMLGWIALSPTSTRHAYRGVAEVSIYIDESARRIGVGEALIQAVIKESEENGIWTLQSCIIQINYASRALHEKCGFREMGYREKAAKDNYGVWQNTVYVERRSKDPRYQ